MELLNTEVFNAVKALNEVFEIELPVRTSLGLSKLIGRLDEAFQAIDKVRIGLVNKYGEQNPKTHQTEVTPDSINFPKFMEEYNELMSQTTEITFDVVKLPQEVNGKPLVIKPALLIPLQKLVEIEPVAVVK